MELERHPADLHIHEAEHDPGRGVTTDDSHSDEGRLEVGLVDAGALEGDDSHGQVLGIFCSGMA